MDRFFRDQIGTKTSDWVGGGGNKWQKPSVVAALNADSSAIELMLSILE